MIGAGLQFATQMIGQAQANKAMKTLRNNIMSQKQKNEDWYNRRYNEDATQTASAQRLLNLTEQRIRERNKAAAGTAAVMGGTDESVAATQAANASAMADTNAQIAAQSDARKSQIEQQYMQRDQQYDNSLNNLQLQKANNIAESTKGLSSSFGTLGGAVDDYLGAK
jgi:hypothetical protein